MIIEKIGEMNMIKMDYGDAVHRKMLEQNFVALLDKETDRQKEWTRLRKKLYGIDAAFKTLLPTKIKKIMILPFDKLANIYERYTALEYKKGYELHDDLKVLFSYEAKEANSRGEKFNAMRSAFVTFFTDNKNGFNLHTCYYCDMSYINYFPYNGGKRTQFDLDHVLDKGRCPIVALSLYNFVPSCPTCNGPHIKGQRNLVANLAQRIKLSPTSDQYDFENKAHFWIRPVSGIVKNVGFLKHQDDYMLDIDTSKDSDYEKEIDLFFLRARYNFHKCEALRLEDLKRQYTPTKIKEMAQIICNIGKNQTKTTNLAANAAIQQIRADIFETGFFDKNHRAFGKLHKDILNG